ncbi:hypothetical protein QP173_09190, partial [Aerococcus urinae]|uniref:hypothetical protein n=1 Tax=Aerococcus urinae TaxID=1376 RepID=UPI00254A4480
RLFAIYYRLRARFDFGVFNFVFGGLHFYKANGVESGSACPASDLVEFAGRKVAGASAVELG